MLPHHHNNQMPLRCQAIVNQLPVLICCFLPGGEISFVNEAYCNYFQKSADELIGANFLSLIPVAQRQQVLDNLAALTVSSPTQSHEHAVLTPRGTVAWQRWINRAIFDAEENLVEYHSIGEDITERKLAQQAQMESEELHRIVLSQISDAVFMTDEAGFLTYICPNAEVIFGYAPEEVSTLGHIEKLLGGRLFVPSELAPEEELKNIERVVTDKSGTAHTVLVNVKRVAIKEGRFLYTCRDITERKNAQEALSESEDRYSQLFNSESDAIMVFDARSRQFEDANPTALNLLGYAREEFLKLNVEDISVEDAKTRDYIEKMVRGDSGDRFVPLTYLRRKNGTMFPVQIYAGTFMSCRRQKVIGAARDISGRVQAETALRKSEQQFRKVFENAGIGIAIADWEGRLQQCNPAYCRILGYSEAELLQATFDTFIHPEDRDANMAQVKRLKDGEMPFFEITNRYLHKAGHSVWVEKFLSVLQDETGQPAYILGLVTDITKRKETEDLLNDLNRTLAERTNLAEQRAADIQHLAMELSMAESRERQRIASVLHDDLQQMLAYLKIQLTTQFSRKDAGETADHLGGLIDNCIDRCRNLAHDLNPPILKKKNFPSALKWLCRQMQERHGLMVELQAAPDVDIRSFVLASMLIRSIRELLFNVVKHSGQKCAAVETRFAGDQVQITVRDDGKGCAQDILKDKQNSEDVFGLFDIEDRINFLGGNVQIESQAGRGFCVTLAVPQEVAPLPEKGGPISASGIPDTTQPSAAVRPRPSEDYVRVLIADDHELMRESLADLLQKQSGIQLVGTAADGREAVRLAKQLRPDVILMDISMPVLDGIKATTEVRRQHPGIRIIGFSIHKDADTRQAIIDAGACACLLKTSPPEELIACIRSAARRGA